MTFCGKKVLVTGGTGFIGGRLVEKLILECDARVRVLVRNFTTAVRIARFSLEMIPGDVNDPEAVRRAADGCDVIFHCAYGNKGTLKEQRAITVGGTRAVAEAALKTGVSRMVHVSTVSVYGQTPDGDLDETAPRRRSGEAYADTKLEAEELVLHYYSKHGLPVVVIQPTIVYGPFARVWTIGPITQLKNGRVVLVDGGSGLCNAVYVDDVVDAMVLAATKDGAVGEAFLISGEVPVTWRDFYGAYEQMLGIQSTVSMSMHELRSYVKQRKRADSTIRQVLRVLREKPNVRSFILQLPAVSGPYRFVRSVLPEPAWECAKKTLLGRQSAPKASPSPESKPIHLPSDSHVALFRSKTRVRIDKAKRMLGYHPRFDLERGMWLTEQWARWANLLG